MILKINPAQNTKKIVQFIKKTLKNQGFKKVIIPLSGGIDSSVCLMLAIRALTPKNVLVVKLPYDKQKNKTANQIIELAKIPYKNILTINIKPAVNAFAKILNCLPKEKILLGNIIARTRMIIVYHLAKKYNALVCGTENKSEYLLGYFTLFGDQACDIAPIEHLYKTQVIKLAKYLGIPQNIIDQPPTAGLWQGQTDKKELGFSYEEADPILYLAVEKKYQPQQIVKKGFSKKLVTKVLTRVNRFRFKHQIPYRLK